jgi:hypothetical protein
MLLHKVLYYYCYKIYSHYFYYSYYSYYSYYFILSLLLLYSLFSPPSFFKSCSIEFCISYHFLSLTPHAFLGLIQTDRLNLSTGKSRRPQSASAVRQQPSSSTLFGSSYNDPSPFKSDLPFDERDEDRNDGDGDDAMGGFDGFSSPTNRFGPSSAVKDRDRGMTDRGVGRNKIESIGTGSLLDKHIRKMQEDQAGAHVPMRIKSKSTSKLRPSSSSGSRSGSKQQQNRPYSAGAIRPGSASGLKAVRNPKTPAESMFMGKEKSTSVLEKGPIARDKVIPSGFYQSERVIKDASPTSRPSSAFALLDNLHKMNTDNLF